MTWEHSFLNFGTVRDEFTLFSQKVVLLSFLIIFIYYYHNIYLYHFYWDKDFLSMKFMISSKLFVLVMFQIMKYNCINQAWIGSGCQLLNICRIQCISSLLSMSSSNLNHHKLQTFRFQI